MDAALIILDGWGIGSDGRDAVAAARTPTFDRLRSENGSGTLTTHGGSVGLPTGQMGNSEVGHLTIGAGRVVSQSSTRISDAIADGSIADNEALSDAIEHARAHDGRVHLMGLVSDGGVHSLQSHLHALIELIADHEVPAVTHAFTDGRDTPPTSGIRYLRELEAVASAAGTGHVATVSGRYYAMDRDENWDRTKRAYDAIVNRSAEHTATSAVESIENAYDREETDEYVVPTLIEGGPALTDGDAVVFCNFRADRARQLTRMLADIRPEWSFETTPPDTRLVTMTEYDATFDLPVAFPPNEPTDTLGEVVAAHDRTQLRLAESEKYAHVTYFLNGGREVEFAGEHRTIVDSPDVPTYDHQPEMSAPEVTDAAIDAIDRDDPALLVLNYANPDMVGHTGDFEAAVAAVEAVDAQLNRLVEACREAGAQVFITADHGNADEMGTPEDPHTAHTTNPVPFVAVTDDDHAVREDGTLPDIAPTVLSAMGIEVPDRMTGESLVA
ncbi:2,3-bisphosphoglycerate-independent phosphoglycerate mutase [Halocatena salina]|uniref:2,3-bisphosphoglycerate-independent phosphoglycerate mutase n=1 Tax=Halocatena salina TaxID=2934340 RepID=A0A8U0A4S6_9EURY|nr:2,3-bisphosphoglycerate-independent phosphoglycerate mutase [Halocatena salina]UPM43799.1 2,3-bisphosphoglycerate-independent phosphoglycerate mutase [Halocatena salina]